MTAPVTSLPPAPTGASPWVIERWTRSSITFASATVLLLAVLSLGPLWLQAGTVDRLTTLFIYVILAVMWNALAGYAGLVSIGHQAFFGLGAYAMVRLADAGLGPYPALLVGAMLVALVAVPLAVFMLRLQGGEFAIGMWVVAALAHLCVNLDTLVQGETGTSMIALQQYAADDRRAYTYWAALAAMAGLCWVVFWLLRSKVGTAAQAIRDNETAAISLGVRVVAIKRLVFVLSAFGCAIAGGLWLATSISFQPKTYFSVQWTAYMIFMVLVGGIGTMEGPILGALLFFAVETLWGGQGVLYLIGLGAIAMLFALFLPKGIWGAVQQRWDVHLLSAGYRVRSLPEHRADAGPATPQPGGRNSQA
ncbi:MAG: branched-chain amino acid ABC transporter permease [Acidovorax sp.]|uniref:branched-chain amino acid ABC transporter permease n=1 Tax=Acidovorax sp. TaxID=1872122 RepID=UPI00260EA78F|nr:branched-chain amino acid ABC transporter permease [Acidovorax sp.]MDH4462456.1 branched-chain amino acid ABC transporter permease [Acidovorax sp.]